MSFIENNEGIEEGKDDEWDLDHVYDNDDEIDN